MKKPLFIILLLIINLTTKAQNKNPEDYIPMAVENAQWIVFRGDDDGFPPFEEFYWGYRIEGETIINDVIYKKVYSYDLVPSSSDPNFFMSFNETLFGAIRDDITNKRVYGIQFCSESVPNSCVCDEEFLIYDFGLNINDSFDGFCVFEDFSFYLGDITQETIFNQKRTVQNIFDDTGDTFVLRIYEGIGGSSGPFESLGIPLGGSTASLINYCVGTNNECFVLATNDNTLNNIFQIYPNPVINNLTINADFNTNITIQIFNSLGKTIIEKELSDNQNTIDVSSLEKGIYFLKYNNQKQKFIKQ